MDILLFCFSMTDSFTTASRRGGGSVSTGVVFLVFLIPSESWWPYAGFPSSGCWSGPQRGRDLMIDCPLQAVPGKGEMRLVSADPKVQPENCMTIVPLTPSADSLCARESGSR